MDTNSNRIQIQGDGRYEEAVAGEAGIYPGMLLKINSSGEVIKHTTAGGALGDETLIAMEDALKGGTITTVATSGDSIPFFVGKPGDVYNLYFPAASAIDIAVADKIISNGDGYLKETTGTPAKTVGIALEANDLTASADDAAHSEVRLT